jgi:type IV secretion system protein VirD4
MNAMNENDVPCTALPLAYEACGGRATAGFVSEAPPAADGRLITDASESHLLVIAPTGAGKGRSVLLPWLLSYPGCVIVVDPKGEGASVCARWRSGLGQPVCVVDPWSSGTTHALNPLDVLLRDSTDLGDDCLTLAELIVGEAPATNQDPFWRSNALHLLTALMGWVWVRADITGNRASDDGTLAAVWCMLHADDFVLHLAKQLDIHGDRMPLFVREGLVNFLSHEGERVRTSVRSEAVSLMRIFGSERVQRATGKTTLPLGILSAGDPASVFFVVPPERLISHAAYLRIQLGALLALTMRRRRRPASPTLFLLDELGSLGPLPQLRQAVTLLRGYGVRVALFVQSLAQLKSLWPIDHEIITDNCGIWLSFGATRLAAAREVADKLGDISAETLFALASDHMVVHRAGQGTVLARKLDYLHDELFAGRFEPNPLHAVSSASASAVEGFVRAQLAVVKSESSLLVP